MIYKKSIYNIILSEDKFLDEEGNTEYPIYNTYTGSFGVMNKAAKDLYDSNEKFWIKEEESSDIGNRISLMVNNGFLVDVNIDELSRVKCMNRIKRYDNSTLNITIAPTLACNMDCPYCFEQKSGYAMSGEVQREIIEYVKKKSSGISQLHIFWYGGEPLLELEIVKSLSKTLIALCNEKNILYSASVTTNGYLLTEEVSKFLSSECKINAVQVTIDGCRDAHDKRRHLKNGKSSFNAIVNNVETASKYLFVKIRSNIDKNNMHDIKKLINYLYTQRNYTDNKNIQIYFFPVSDFNGSISHSGCYSWDDFAYIHDELIEYLFEVGAYKEAVYSVPRSMPYACEAITSRSVVIDPDGYMYKCNGEIGKKELSVGKISEGQRLDDKLMKWLLLDISSECDNCIFLPICQSGCPLERLANKKKDCSYKNKSYKKSLEITYLINKKTQKECRL